MTLELDIDPVYMDMLEQIEKQSKGDPKADLKRIIENEIHQSFQQYKSAQ